MLFGGAYSHYPLTDELNLYLLNFSASPEDKQHSVYPLYEGPNLIDFCKINIFDSVVQSKVTNINVLANSMYFDYCAKSVVVIENCVEIALSGMKLLKIRI